MKLLKTKWDRRTDVPLDLPCRNKEQMMLPISFYATERHYLEHLAPVALELLRREPTLLKKVYVQKGLGGLAASLGLPGEETRARIGPLPDGGPVIVSASGDARIAANWVRPIVLMEHGCGISYQGVSNPSYSGGGRTRHGVSLFLFPNEISASKERSSGSTGEVEVVGCPKMDMYFRDPPRPKNKKPVIVVSAHFDCHVCPEARTAFFFYEDYIRQIGGIAEVRGHYHPRIRRALAPRFRARGIQTVDTFSEVMESADLYVVDNSSTLYEFAATGRPVVALNCPLYRKDINHGIRFWDHIPGLQCDSPGELVGTVREALEDPEGASQARGAATDAVFTFTDGGSAERAVNRILKWRES